MKKVLFLALAAAAVMSCSESEEIENSAPNWSLTGGTYYWPMTDNLQFFAYGNPGTGALTYNQPAAGAIYPSITYTVADVAAQTDLVAAKVTDATKASNASGVSLKFGHILTQINFTVKAADALTYKLKTLTISGVHNKGTYGFDDSTWKSQEGTATYAHTIDDGALEVNTTERRSS